MITKEIDNTTHQYYKSLEEVKIRIKKVELPLNWIVDVSEDVMTPSEYVDLFTVPKVWIKIDDSLACTIQIFEWLCLRIMSCIKPVKDQLKHKIGKFTYHVIPKTRNNQAEDELFSINPF